MPSSLLLATASLCQGADEAGQIETLAFARVGGRERLLDLHRPAGTAAAPLAVYVHGGAWRAGSRDQMPLGALVRSGFAVAGAERLQEVADFLRDALKLEAP